MGKRFFGSGRQDDASISVVVGALLEIGEPFAVFGTPSPAPAGRGPDVQVEVVWGDDLSVDVTDRYADAEAAQGDAEVAGGKCPQCGSLNPYATRGECYRAAHRWHIEARA